MSSSDILRTAVKIGGLVLIVYSVIQAVAVVPVFIDQARHSEFYFPVLSVVANFGIPILFGLLFWLFPARIADTIIKNDLTGKTRDKFLIGIEHVAIRILGLYLLYHGIADIVMQYASYHQAVEAFGKNTSFVGRDRFAIGFVVTGVEIVLALGLVIGATGISSIIRKLKTLPDR